MMVAVLGFGTDLELRIVNALKTLAVMAANVVASLIFIVVADLDWQAIVLLAAGSVVGGYVGVPHRPTPPRRPAPRPDRGRGRHRGRLPAVQAPPPAARESGDLRS